MLAQKILDPDTVPSNRAQFVGNWKLIAFEVQRTDDDGPVRYPLGENPVGLLSYTADGYMSVNMMDSSRPKFASYDYLKGTTDEIKAAFEGYIAYFGTFEILESHHLVSHKVEAAWFPNWVGQQQRRFYEFSGNRLHLSSLPMPIGDGEYVAILIWERVG